MKYSTMWVLVICAIAALRCGANLDPFSGDASTGTDTDTDADTDADTDTDTDCVPVPESYQQCGTDGNVHWFDSCDVEGELVDDCSAIHFICENLTDETAQCVCMDYWHGDLCDEYRVYVNVFGTAASPDGLSWGTAFTRVQPGIDLCHLANQAADPPTQCQVWVSQGTYYIYRLAPEDTVQLMPDVDVYGGFSAMETELDQRDWVTNLTTLSGYDDGGTDQVYHVVTGSDDAIIDGFTITGGNAVGTGADDRGGGMINWSCSPTVVNCTLENNYAVMYGGAVYNYSSAAVFVNCNFTSNTTPYRGGGIFNFAGNSTLTSCIFHGNSAVSRGGGMFNSDNSTPELVNVTFHNNSSEGGGAIYNTGTCSPVITNCILWGNIATSFNNEIYNDTGANPVVTYGNIEGGYTGTGNIDSDPLFVDAGAGDLHIGAGSPCIDAANGDVAPATDLDGNPREDDTTVTDTGTGTPTYTDIGAYEYQP